MISGIPVKSQPLCDEFGSSLDCTRNPRMAKVGSSIDHTRNSCCLAKVGSKSGNNQSFPDSLGTYIIWILTRADWYQCYWNFEKSSNYQLRLWPGWKFADA